jgi:His/Glu/Gln/Arg/opine family amino acid ABC transporter permease subunit
MFGGYIFHWAPVLAAFSEFADGTLIALEIAILSIAGAFAIGVVGALASRSSNRALRTATKIYVEAMRNSPSLVKMYFIFFGLPSVGLFPSPFVSGVVALALHNGAYMTEIVRGGLEAVHDTQAQGALSLGMSGWQTLRIVLLPQAIVYALPAISNNWVEIVKDTSLTSALAVRELFFVVIGLLSATQRSFEILIIAGAIYLTLNSLVSGALKVAEARARWRPR